MSDHELHGTGPSEWWRCLLFFDQGGAHHWSGRDDSRIAMSGQAKAFSSNVELTSLGAGHGCPVRPFVVDDWLDDGHIIELSPGQTLLVLDTPGHTPDHIALYYPGEALCFVGDHIYPWTALDIAGLGHSLPHYVASTERLLTFVRAKEQEGATTAGNGDDGGQQRRRTVRLACGHVDAELPAVRARYI